MPTLTINGQKVSVDDSFDALPPAQQEATIEEIAKSFGAAPAAATAAPAAPAESAFNQGLRAAATMGVRGLGGAVDFIADPLAPLRRVISPSLERIEAGAKFRPGEAAGDAFFGATGIREMQPESALGRIGLAAGTGAVGGGPFGLSAAALSGLGGALGQGTMEAGSGLGVSPDNTERAATIASFAPMALAPPVRGAVNYAARQARETFGPAMSQAYREGLVGEQLRTAASDPAAFAQSLAEPRVPDLVPGSKPTTFQYTGDPGIGQLERGQRTVAAAPFLERMQEQGAARVGAVQDLAPGGAVPGAVGDLLRQNLARLDAEGEANIRRATQNAAQAMEQAGGRLNVEDYGALIREQLEAAKAAAKQRESALWQAIDPNGTLTIDGLPVRKEAAKIASEISKMSRQPEGREAEVFANARLLGSESKFSDFSALRSNLLQAIRDERINGQTPALRRMQQLRSSMDDAISGAAERAAQSNPELFARVTADLNQVAEGVGTEAAAQAGGNNQAGAVGLPGSGASATGGAPRTAGTAAGGFGGAAGPQGVSGAIPPRPQDLIQFLMERGGLRDSAGELRNMDLHKVNQGYFGRLSRESGMPLDEARELAAEAGYLHRDADINDLLNALRRNQQGTPVFRESDPAVYDWLDYERVRRSGEAVPFPESNFVRPAPAEQAFPPQPANFNEAAAARYRAAADATRERAARFNNQLVGPALAERGAEYRMIESRVPERFLSSAEGVKAFTDAGGTPATLKDALVGDLRRSATSPDGSLNLPKFQTWLKRRDAAIRSLPDMEQTLGNVARAQDAVDTATAASRQQRLDFERGAARHFLNAEPVQAVQAALGGKNPVGDMTQIVGMVKGDPAAMAGLQRAVADYVERNFIGNADALKSDAFQTFISRSGPALDQVFTPAQMQAMRNVAADLKRSNLSIAGSKIPGQSNTAQDAMLVRDRMSTFRAYLWPGTAAGAVGLATYFVPGAGLVGAAVSATGAAKTLAMIKRAGLEKVDALRTEALLNPEVAAALLMKATPANRPFIAAKLNSALGRLVGAGAVSEDLKKPPARRAAR
jgi:hypothetical protein